MTSNDKPGDDKKKYVWIGVLILLVLTYCIANPISTQPQPVLATVTLTRCEQGIKDYLVFTDEFETRMEDLMTVAVEGDYDAAMDELLAFVKDYEPAECVMETHGYLIATVVAMRQSMLTDDPEAEALWDAAVEHGFKEWGEGMADLAKKYGEDW
jgi:hypothetical protein